MYNKLATFPTFQRLTPSVRFVGVIVIFCMLSALSYWNKSLALSTILAFGSLVILCMPMIGWALLIFVSPIQYFFAFGAPELSIIRMTLLLLVSFRHLAILLNIDNLRKIEVLILLAFLALLLLHIDSTLPVKYIVGAPSFVLSLVGIFLISQFYGKTEEGEKLASIAVFSTVVVSIILSAFLLYGVHPEILSSREPLETMRLAGVQDNPNSLAKFMLAVVLMTCYFALRHGLSVVNILLIFISFLCLTATASKSVLVSVFGIVIVLFPIITKNKFTGRALSIASTGLIGFLTWFLVLSPLLQNPAAVKWNESKKAVGAFQDVIKERITNVPKQDTLSKRIMHDLRVDKSYEMSEKDNKTQYKERKLSFLNIGQRDRTWEAGLEVFQENWLWGIGYHNWPREMKDKIHLPLDSPHNGLLEIAGAYGIVGGILYLLMLAIIVREIILMRHHFSATSKLPQGGWLLLFAVAIIFVEQVEVGTMFGLTIHGIWFWILWGIYKGISTPRQEKAIVPMENKDISYKLARDIA